MSIGIGGLLAIVAGSIFAATTIIIVWSYVRKQKPKAFRTISWIFVTSISLALIFVLVLSLFSSVTSSTRGANPTATAQAVRTAAAQAVNTRIAQYYATATANAIATATAFAKVVVASNALQNPYPPFGGKLILNDLLKVNNTSKLYKWDQSADCTFSNEAYHAIQPTVGYYWACYATPIRFSDFVYQIEMTIINGDCGGIIFRGQSEYYQHYYFRVCQDGTFIFSVYKNNDYHQTQTLKGGTTSAINTGSGEPNLIAVVAQGSILDLYVNLQHIARVYNDVNSRGEIAVVAESLTSSTDVAFNNAKVWSL